MSGHREGGVDPDVSRDTSLDQAKLSHYTALVRRWSTRLDLVAPGDLERFEERHVRDSLRLRDLLDDLPEGPAVDVGSGAGLPGIPLAIAGPERPWRLLEPRQRRAAFLEEVVRELQLNCEVVPLRAQDAAADPRLAAAHVLATARALAVPAVALDLIQPLIGPGGVAAVFMGGDAKVPEHAVEWQPGIAILRET